MELTDSNFQTEVIESAEPVLVDFWGPWCRPCHALAPIIDKLAEAGHKVGKVNIDENQGLVQEYGISAVPTVLIFKNGNVVKKFVGLQKEQVLIEAIEGAKS